MTIDAIATVTNTLNATLGNVIRQAARARPLPVVASPPRPAPTTQPPDDASASDTCQAPPPSCSATPTLTGQPLAYFDLALDAGGALAHDGFDAMANSANTASDALITAARQTPLPFDDMQLLPMVGLLKGQAWGFGLAGDIVNTTADVAGDVALETGRRNAEQIIQIGDDLWGQGLVDTPLEDNLLQHWLNGSGSTVALSGNDWQAVQDHPATQAIDPDQFTAEQAVTLEDGSQGYAVAVDFSGELPDGKNSLDGSIGRATLYYDQEGNLVGLYDSYDFSNDNAPVDATNAAGAVVGAQNFAVRAGVIGTSPSPDVPCPPDLAESTASLGERIGESIERRVDELFSKIV